MSAGTRVLVVGASVAGYSAVRALRQLGHEAEVTMVDHDPDAPYDRPPLSKSILTSAAALEDIRLPGTSDLHIHHVRGRAVQLDAHAKLVRLADGRELDYDRLLLACGSEPITPPELAGHPGVQVLRTWSDAVSLRESMRSDSRLVLVGGGFIGCEVASAASGAGASVDLVEAGPAPLAAALGDNVAEFLAWRLPMAGIAVHANSRVLAIGKSDEPEHPYTVLLTDGARLRAERVLVGIGVRARVDWLAGSGVAVDRGVVCDEHGRTNLRDVFAAGDVAHWYHPFLGTHSSVEHWTNANETGRVVAVSILDGHFAPPRSSVPYIWSDQFGDRIQIVGWPKRGELRAEVVDRAARQLELSFQLNGQVVGAVLMNRGGEVPRYRHAVLATMTQMPV